MDFDEVRYWDLRENHQVYHPYNQVPDKKSLPSDSTKRLDLILLEANATEAAQKVKLDIEQQQRNERKYREEAEERRNNGGPKYQVRTKEMRAKK